MGKIVAVSGVMKSEFCDKIVALAGVRVPKVLIIPTARYDHPESYTEDIGYFTQRNCNVSRLRLFLESPSSEEINEKILNADIIYVPGGNTLKMMRIWRAQKVDRVLRQAYRKRIVLCGPSAGANCWFRQGISGPFPSSTSNFELSLNFLNELDINPWPSLGKIISQRLHRAFGQNGVHLSAKTKVYTTLGFTGNRTGHLWQMSDESNHSVYWIRRKDKQLKIYIPDRFIKVSGLGLVNTILGSHYAERKEGIKKVMHKTSGVAIGLENRCALMIVDDQYRILSTDDDKAYKVFWRKGAFCQEIVESKKEWMSLSPLLRK